MSTKQNERLVAKINEIKKKHKDNKRCADCGEMGPGYVNLTVGTFVCTKCAGHLRSLNHKIKGISMSTFTPEEVKILEKGGNERAAAMYMAKYDSEKMKKILPSETQKFKDFMKKKYEDKKWYSEDVKPTEEIQSEEKSRGSSFAVNFPPASAPSSSRSRTHTASSPSVSEKKEAEPQQKPLAVAEVSTGANLLDFDEQPAKPTTTQQAGGSGGLLDDLLGGDFSAPTNTGNTSFGASDFGASAFGTGSNSFDAFGSGNNSAFRSEQSSFGQSSTVPPASRPVDLFGGAGSSGMDALAAMSPIKDSVPVKEETPAKAAGEDPFAGLLGEVENAPINLQENTSHGSSSANIFSGPSDSQQYGSQPTGGSFGAPAQQPSGYQQPGFGGSAYGSQSGQTFAGGYGAAPMPQQNLGYTAQQPGFGGMPQHQGFGAPQAPPAAGPAHMSGGGGVSVPSNDAFAGLVSLPGGSSRSRTNSQAQTGGFGSSYGSQNNAMYGSQQGNAMYGSQQGGAFASQQGGPAYGSQPGGVPYGSQQGAGYGSQQGGAFSNNALYGSQNGGAFGGGMPPQQQPQGYNANPFGNVVQPNQYQGGVANPFGNPSGFGANQSGGLGGGSSYNPFS